MSGILNGKIAIVTGGTKGIGKATAIRLVRDGASVIITYGGDSAASEKALQEIGGGHKVIAVQADAAKVADIERLVRFTVDKFGKIDIVVANAGWWDNKSYPPNLDC